MPDSAAPAEAWSSHGGGRRVPVRSGREVAPTHQQGRLSLLFPERLGKRKPNSFNMVAHRLYRRIDIRFLKCAQKITALPARDIRDF